MDVKVKKTQQSEEDIRKGPWSVEEDTILVNYVATHGHGRWNSLARCAGLKRSGKSCRLRWLNYLRPDVRRGNITLQEQITILDLHSRWGNRWSKIARHLPGRTDNEIKNYWRTRVIKQAKNLNCDVDSKQFKDVLRYDWMPRLIERMHPPSQTFAPAHTGPDPAALAHASASSAFDSSCAQFQGRFDSQHLDYSASGVSQSFNFNDPMLEQGNSILPLGGGDLMESLWGDENLWLMRQLCHDLEI